MNLNWRDWRRRTWVWIASSAALGVGAAVAYRALYTAPRDALLTQLGESRSRAKALEDALAERASTGKKLKEFGSSTLGKKEDIAVDRFRNGLSRIAESAGLSDVQINSGSARASVSPLVSQSKAPESIKKALKKTADFSMIGGTVEGVGTWAQIVRTIALLESQPWIHRVDGFTIDPAGKDRTRFKFKAGVATLLAPDLVGAKDADPDQAGVTVEADQSVKQIAARNPFQGAPPEPPVVVAQNAPAPPPAPPLPPYNDWRLTGVITGRQGVEAWLVNVKTNEGQTLRVGSKLLDVELVEAAGERAVFLIAGQKYELYNGETFNARRALK